MNYEIRKMQSKDSDRVLEIFQQGISNGNATFDKELPTWETWDNQHTENCRWVIENSEDKIVGWAALKPVSQRICFSGVAEVSIYLDNSVQGKGLGKMLLKKLSLDSEEYGFWTLQSGIFPENEASLLLHKKLGFRVVGRRDKIGKQNGVWRDIILLERRSRLVF
ncbi:MAG: GNAT family N-acetyltransferase [Cruoricaptor ignavus]|nr:GNAT family N-acetyltransferase [Cruoricaptor ignavus]